MNTFTSRLFSATTLILLVVFCTSDVSARYKRCWRVRSQYGCTGATDLTDLDKAAKSTVKLVYHTSSILHIHGNAFYRFNKTLQVLDMHKAGISSIDSEAFAGLGFLQNLTLWGNNLTWVTAAWFVHLPSLRTLDLSSNAISYIDENAFLRFPMLQILYLDSNKLVSMNPYVFGYPPLLQRVKLGNNPWTWLYRALIAQQLENRRIDYYNGSEQFRWINHVVWYCMEHANAVPTDEGFLDCLVQYLIKQRKELPKNFDSVGECRLEMNSLFTCTKGTTNQNASIPVTDTTRRVFQGFIGTLNPIKNANDPWQYRSV